MGIFFGKRSILYSKTILRKYFLRNIGIIWRLEILFWGKRFTAAYKSLLPYNVTRTKHFVIIVTGRVRVHC